MVSKSGWGKHPSLPGGWGDGPLAVEVPLTILTSLSPKLGSRQEEHRAGVTVQSM